MKAGMALLRRDLRLAFRGTEGVAAVFFFAAVTVLFPFALGAKEEVLRAAAPGVVWVAALLSALLSLEAVYHRDFEDGTFDLLLLSPASAAEAVAAKMAAHWAAAGLPLLLAAGVALLMLHVPAGVLGVLLASLGMGTIYMSLLGGLGAALTFGARRPGVLLGLLVLPLFVPMLVLGVMAGEAVLRGAAARPFLLLQGALAVAALPLALGAAAKLVEMQARAS